jgi:hypothetical protein
MDAELVKLLNDNNTDIKREIREIMKDQATTISARVDLKIEEKLKPIEINVATIIEHNKKQNGWVKEHGERLDKLDAAEISNKLTRSKLRKISKNWLRITIFILIVLFGLNTLFDYITLKDIIEFLKALK